MQVNTIMSPVPCAVSVSTTIAEARRLSLIYEMRSVFVVDRAGVLVGLLRAEDLATADRDRRVTSILRKTPAIDDDDDLEEAIALMTANEMTTLPVVGPHFDLVGAVSYADVVRWAGGSPGSGGGSAAAADGTL